MVLVRIHLRAITLAFHYTIQMGATSAGHDPKPYQMASFHSAAWPLTGENLNHAPVHGHLHDPKLVPRSWHTIQNPKMEAPGGVKR
jgi:hypothetical protein